MSLGAALQTVDAVCTTLKREFGDLLEALYLYGSLATGKYNPNDSDINLLAILGDEVNISFLREQLQPLWSEHGKILRKTPIISTKSELVRHINLNPLFGQHLASDAQLITGKESLPDPPHVDPLEIVARFARLSLHASSTVASPMLSEKEMRESLAELRRLARELSNTSFENNGSATDLFAEIQREILKRLKDLSYPLWPDKIAPGAPPLLSDLRAVYDVESRLVLVLPDLAPDELANRIKTSDWPEVVRRVANQYRGLRVTTPSQLRLVLQFETAADFRLRSYNHAWGLDPLDSLNVEPRNIYRDLGRLPSDLHISGFLHAFVITEDTDLAMLVHDFQNKLLNIQLRNELLCRIEETPVTTPPFPMPDRSELINIRIQAIYDHLNWWSDYYARQMARIIANEA